MQVLSPDVDGKPGPEQIEPKMYGERRRCRKPREHASAVHRAIGDHQLTFDFLETAQR